MDTMQKELKDAFRVYDRKLFIICYIPYFYVPQVIFKNKGYPPLKPFMVSYY